jgi:tRNA(Ile)-lysidine synthase
MLVRPLLSCDRAQVISYLRGKGLGFRTDPTNQDRRFLRNRIRHEIVPALRRVLPGFPAGLLGTAARMTLLDSFLKEESVRRLPWRRAGGGFRLPADLFFSASPALRAQSLLHLFDLVKAGGPSRRLPARFLTPVLGERPPAGGILLRGHGVRLRADGGELAWERDIVTPIKKSYLMTAETDGIYHVRCAGACVELKWAAREDTVVGDAEIRACAVDPPLVLRSKRRGDGLPLEHGRKSLKELYCEWKVPPEDRQAIPLLADRRGVVAVLGGAWGHPTRVRSGARAQGAEERVIIRVRRDREAEAPREGTREQQF